MVSPNENPPPVEPLDPETIREALNRQNEILAKILRVERAQAYAQGRADALAELAQSWGVKREQEEVK